MNEPIQWHCGICGGEKFTFDLKPVSKALHAWAPSDDGPFYALPRCLCCGLNEPLCAPSNCRGHDHRAIPKSCSVANHPEALLPGFREETERYERELLKELPERMRP